MSSNMGSSGLPSGGGSRLSSSAPLADCVSAGLGPPPPGMGSPGFHPDAQHLSGPVLLLRSSWHVSYALVGIVFQNSC